MRKHRVALIVVSSVAAVAVVGSTLAGTSTPSTAIHTSEAQWSQPRPVPPTPSDARALALVRLDFATYVRGVQSQQRAALVALAAAASAAAAARARSAAAVPRAPAPAGSTSPPTTTTPPPAGSGVDLLETAAPASVLAAFRCIEFRYESGGNPTAVNPSSGDGGLFQFAVGTWLGNGGGVYAPRAELAPAWAQDNVAYWTWQHDGFSPWNGDNACWA